MKKKQNEEISKINNDNQILKQQLDNILTEIKQLKKESQFNNNQIHHTDEDKKENDSNPPSKFDFDLFRSSSKLINTLTGHTDWVRSIDYSTFDDCQFICSGSEDKTIRVWNVDNNKQIQSFDGHSSN
ncbi:WD-repeat protein, partial [Reticulomyxa filosa]